MSESFHDLSYICLFILGVQNLYCKAFESIFTKDLVFDLGSTVSIFKRSALLKGVITKLLGDTKLVRTLAGHLKTHKVVMMQD